MSMEKSERGYKIFAFIADIHIGRQTIPAASIKRQLKDHFIKPLKDFYRLDGIFIGGDIMHSIVSLNSDYAEVFYWFVDQVYKVAKKKDSTVVIIRGTRSHDNDQLNNIKHYQNNDDGVDFRVYDTFEEITIWDDYKVLVLPDNRVKKESEIDKLIDGKDRYDLIIGHGTIDTMQFFIQESETMVTKAYTYDVDQLCAVSKGPVLFGHIHQYQCHLNKFYYSGPFTLLERGGESAGFLVGGICDADRSKFKIEFYENPDTARYYDIEVTKDIIDDYPIDDIISGIDDIIRDIKPEDLVTLRITRGDERDAADKVFMLEERYRKDRRFSIIKKIKTKREEEIDRENEDRKEKYSYLMDPTLTLPQIMYRYYTENVAPTLSTSTSASITEESFARVLGTLK